MRYFLIAAICFLIGAILWAQRGLNKLKSEAVNLAVQIYEQWVQETINSDTIKNSQFSLQAQDFFKQQTEAFKKQASNYAKDLIKQEIDSLFEAKK